MSSGRSRQYVALPSILHAAMRTSSLILNGEEQDPNKPQHSVITEKQSGPQAAVLEATATLV